MQIKENYQVKNESTFRIGGRVNKAAFPETADELIELLQSNEYDIVLGNCSNVLFSSSDINKKIIFTRNICDFKIEDRKVYVSCGTKGPVIAKECQKRGLTGFEFLIGFPGSFG